MENLKIRVNSEAESKEAQELFFELGYSWNIKGGEKDYLNIRSFTHLTTFDKYIGQGFGFVDHKKITLPELRDLVVLKRNDVGDATHTDGYCSFYVGKDKNYFFSSCDKAWRGTWKNVDILKPIKKPMKEYLIKSGDGKYLLTHHDSIGAVEIPEGATYYAKDASLGKNGNFFFRLRSNDFDFEAVWLESNWIQAIFNVENQDVLWQRNNNQTIASAVESSHPEELPFIDDEPKEYLREDGNGSYILELTCKQEVTEPHAKHWIEVPVGVNFYYSFASGDKFFTKEHSSLGRLLWQRKPPFSINDQYAEIEKVRQTLNQRQEQYGSFKDVAMFTEQMVDVMRKGYYEKLAYNQKMALYMICSKMARIVNGNPNHKDSWHDIAGYATLIDNELESEKDMPF